MKKFKIGDRVKIKSTGKTGMIAWLYSSDKTYMIALDDGERTCLDSKELIRLRKKKKTLSKKECERIIDNATNAFTDISAPIWGARRTVWARTVTKEMLAEMWNLYIWCVPSASVSNAAESKIFEKICKELGF